MRENGGLRPRWSSFIFLLFTRLVASTSVSERSALGRFALTLIAAHAIAPLLALAEAATGTLAVAALEAIAAAATSRSNYHGRLI
jgi:hypothetical protein